MNKDTPVVSDIGVLYAATGSRYVDEAAVSAVSLKKVMPGIKIHLYTDLDEVPEVFDAVSKIENPRLNCYDKVLPMLNSPFEKTLFLDTDTYVCSELSELFKILDRFDILACHIPIQGANSIEGIPTSFPELNTGMVAFRKSEATQQFFERWLRLYEEMGHKADQPAFRRALWEDRNIQSYQLPYEYNLRTIAPGYIAEGAKVKIIHGRHKNWKSIEQKLNCHAHGRVMLLRPFDRFGNKVVVVRTWFDLFKSFLRKFL
jgi:hypothetical protein